MTQVTQNVENAEIKNKKKYKKYGLITLGIIFVIGLIILSISLYNQSKTFYISSWDVTCEYNSKFHKITCTQIGDVVPAWLDLDDAPILKYLGGGSGGYTMKLVLSHSNRDYKVLNMTDKEFIRDRNRKFIYELKEQTYSDWAELKRYAKTGTVSNWGSIVLYCSEDNLTDDICKRMKKNHR